MDLNKIIKMAVPILVILWAPICFADDGWGAAKEGAKKRCAKNFEDFQLQAVCVQNEKKGFEKLKGDFGMPKDVATQAKARCATTFEDFQLQAVCMQNEKKGYDKMQQ